MDCNNFFDFDSLNNYVEFDKPLYSIISKRRTARLLFLSPKQYIYKIARGFGGLSYDDATQHVNSEKVEKYMDDMSSGSKFPIGYYTDGSSSQEGRHRALAAMKLGCEEIPVIEFRKISDAELENIVLELKGKSFEEINDIFKEKGFSRGISMLGYNDFKRYMEYNLKESKIKSLIRGVINEVFLSENEIVPPNIPNSMNFWHGGNLDDYSDVIAQKNGRYEYGPGLYATTSYEVVKKYTKGSRKLYMITVANGVEISEAFISLEKATDFINSFVLSSKRKSILQFLSKYIENDKVPADIFNNLILNHKAIQSTKTKYLRSFLVENGIDYEIVNGAFGFGEKMIVLYNMNKILNVIRIKPGDKIAVFDLK